MCLVSEDAYFLSNTSAIVFKPEILDPDRKVRPGLDLITVEKSEFYRIADMRPFVRRRQISEESIADRGSPSHSVIRGSHEVVTVGDPVCSLFCKDYFL